MGKFKVIFKSVAIVSLLGVIFFQNCGQNFSSIKQDSKLDQSSIASFVFPTMKPISSQYSFSKTFVPPVSKQGVSEFRTSMTPSEFDQRYSKLKSMGAAYRQYNLFWSGLENSSVQSSVNPINCPASFQMIPANKSELVALGFHRFRCININTLNTFDNLIKRDQLAGMQSGAVLWSSPPIYRYNGCQGFSVGGYHLRDGCIPRDDAMDDFEDYINLLASRYNGSKYGKLSHFIVWNENASADWFDYSPILARDDMSSVAIERRIDKYVDMLKRTHNALMRHQQAALMYVSIDQIIEQGEIPTHYGNRNLMNGIWARLGVNYSWSLAVHPYGEVDKPAPTARYTFNNLELVANYQKQKLRELGINDPDSYPQSILIASEQGWPLAMTSAGISKLARANQARQICLAHDKVVSMPEVVAVANNYFHSIEPAEEKVSAQSIQGAFFGLIPFNVPNTLENIESHSTGKAFASTMNPRNWKQHDKHYCCQVYGVGCVGPNSYPVPTVESAHRVLGYIDGVQNQGGANVIGGWACMRSMESSISVSLYVGARRETGQFIGNYNANLASEEAIKQLCAANGNAYRFQIHVDNNLANSHQGKPIFIYGVSTLGLDSVELMRGGEFIIPKPSSSTYIPPGVSTQIIFKVDAYLMCNLDVADAVMKGQTTAEKHYQNYGIREGRLLTCNYNFNEAYYLATYPDIDRAVKSGSIMSGLFHYAVYGRAEKRRPVP